MWVERPLHNTYYNVFVTLKVGTVFFISQYMVGNGNDNHKVKCYNVIKKVSSYKFQSIKLDCFTTHNGHTKPPNLYSHNKSNFTQREDLIFCTIVYYERFKLNFQKSATFGLNFNFQTLWCTLCFYTNE